MVLPPFTYISSLNYGGAHRDNDLKVMPIERRIWQGWGVLRATWPYSCQNILSYKPCDVHIMFTLIIHKFLVRHE